MTQLSIVMKEEENLRSFFFTITEAADDAFIHPLLPLIITEKEATRVPKLTPDLRKAEAEPSPSE